MERALFTCELCKKASAAEVHHLLPIGIALQSYVSQIKERGYLPEQVLQYISNAMAICHACHVEIHANHILPYSDYPAVFRALIFSVHARSARLDLPNVTWKVSAISQKHMF